MMGKVERSLKGLSNSELARKTCTSESFISLLLRGKRRAKVGTLRKVADALGVSMDDLDQYLSRNSQGEKPYGWGEPKKAGEAA